MTKKFVTNKLIYQLKITLLNVKPLIWRRFQVESETTLSNLHEILQVVMGWDNYHLHSFSCGEDENIKLSEILTVENLEFLYTYDFGDNWEHKGLVEKILAPDPNVLYPLCLAGKRACPPEDCGGCWGYSDLLKILKKPSHPEYKERKEWVVKRFNSEDFNLENVNKNLSDFKGIKLDYS